MDKPSIDLFALLVSLLADQEQVEIKYEVAKRRFPNEEI